MSSNGSPAFTHRKFAPEQIRALHAQSRAARAPPSVASTASSSGRSKRRQRTNANVSRGSVLLRALSTGTLARLVCLRPLFCHPD